MAKNLIDGDSYEYTEGATQAAFQSLADSVTEIGGSLQTHEDNSNIHLSAAEKSFIDSPFIIGSYFGNGTTRSISIGFKPAFLLIFVSGLPYSKLTYITTDTYKLLTYLGFAAGSYSSPGLTLTSTGFDATDNDLPGYGPNEMRINESGLGYTYIAFKNPNGT